MNSVAISMSNFVVHVIYYVTYLSGRVRSLARLRRARSLYPPLAPPPANDRAPARGLLSGLTCAAVDKHVRKVRHVRNNSWALTIPDDLVRRLGWDNGAYVEMYVDDDGRLVARADGQPGDVAVVRVRAGVTEAGVLAADPAPAPPSPPSAPSTVGTAPPTYTESPAAGPDGAPESSEPESVPLCAPAHDGAPPRAPAEPPNAAGGGGDGARQGHGKEPAPSRGMARPPAPDEPYAAAGHAVREEAAARPPAAASSVDPAAAAHDAGLGGPEPPASSHTPPAFTPPVDGARAEPAPPWERPRAPPAPRDADTEPAPVPPADPTVDGARRKPGAGAPGYC